MSENYEYLFMDIEWNQALGTTEIEDREPIQIGIVAAAEDFSVKKIFSKAIKLKDPDHYNPNTFKVSHVTYEASMQANSEEVVLQKMLSSFPKFTYLVVWTQDTYELFRRGMKTYGLSIPRHKVVILQDILVHIAGDGKSPIGFEIALQQWKIEYKRNFLHYSKHDANYLFQLFNKSYQDYRKRTNGEVCYLNRKSHIIHSSACRFISANIGEAFSCVPKDYIFQGNRVCKICGSADDWKRVQREECIEENPKPSTAYLRMLPLTPSNMAQICDRFHLEYNIVSDMVFVHTVFSRWIVYLEGNMVTELKHESYRQNRSQLLKQHKKCLEGYHTQKLPSNNFYDVINYIKCHDTGTLQKMGRKNRIEVMFDRIKS